MLGDWTQRGDVRAAERFADWLGSLPVERVVVAGNHDACIDAAFVGPEACRATLQLLRDRCQYLENSEAAVRGLRIWGSPFTCWPPGAHPLQRPKWAHGHVRGLACDDLCATIPAGLDIAVTHTPPLGHGDAIDHGGHSGGCRELLLALQVIIIIVIIVKK